MPRGSVKTHKKIYFNTFDCIVRDSKSRQPLFSRLFDEEGREARQPNTIAVLVNLSNYTKNSFFANKTFFVNKTLSQNKSCTLRFYRSNKSTSAVTPGVCQRYIANARGHVLRQANATLKPRHARRVVLVDLRPSASSANDDLENTPEEILEKMPEKIHLLSRHRGYCNVSHPVRHKSKRLSPAALAAKQELIARDNYNKKTKFVPYLARTMEKVIEVICVCVRECECLSVCVNLWWRAFQNANLILH